MATGMTLTLCLSTLHKNRPLAKYVLWSRIDQKSCFKSILAANLLPIVIDTIHSDKGLITDIVEFENRIQELGADNIVCLFATTSCFAPRQSDDILSLGRLCNKYNIPHLINNAYGLQSKLISNKIEHAGSESRIDLFVQSTDKNLMVPVGGAIVAGFDAHIIEAVTHLYPGRASISQTLDVFITLLSLGKNGYMKLVLEREECFEQLKNAMILENLTYNTISIAISLNKFNSKNVAMIGSMLFKRGASGARVVTGEDTIAIDQYSFKGRY